MRTNGEGLGTEAMYRALLDFKCSIYSFVYDIIHDRAIDTTTDPLDSGCFDLIGWEYTHSLSSSGTCVTYTVMCSIMFPLCSDIYKRKKVLENFGQLLRNVFLPLFQATIDPSSHKNLSIFLNQVTCIHSYIRKSMHSELSIYTHAHIQ